MVEYAEEVCKANDGTGKKSKQEVEHLWSLSFL